MTQDIEPLVASVEAFGSATALADRARLLQQIRDQLERLRVADEAFYERASGGVVGALKEDEAAACRDDESSVAEELRCRVLSLQRYLTDTSQSDDPEGHRLLQKAVNTALGYVAGYQNLRDQMVGFAAGQPATGEVLRARPVAGEIDYAELSREHIARYPKIRAALAK